MTPPKYGVSMKLIQNSLARAIIRTPKHHHITPILKSLHWLKIPESVHFKVLSLTYNYLQYSQPTYLRELFTIQSIRSTRLSSVSILCHFPSQVLRQSLSITAPRLWNDLPPELRTFLYLHHYHHPKSQ